MFFYQPEFDLYNSSIAKNISNDYPIFNTKIGKKYLKKIKLNSKESIEKQDIIFKKLLQYLGINYSWFCNNAVINIDSLTEILINNFLEDTFFFVKKDWLFLTKKIIEENIIIKDEIFYIENIVNYICDFESKFNRKIKLQSFNHKSKKTLKKIYFIKDEILNNLFINADEFGKIIIALLSTTGIRISLISKIKKEDINLEKLTIKLESIVNKEYTIFIHPIILTSMLKSDFFKRDRSKEYIINYLKILAKKINIDEKYIYPEYFRFTLVINIILQTKLEDEDICIFLGGYSKNILYRLGKRIKLYEIIKRLPIYLNNEFPPIPLVFKWVGLKAKYEKDL